MDELLQRLQAACAGLTADEIAGQISASQYADMIPDVGVVSQFLAAIGEETDAGAVDEEPEQAETVPQSGND